ncbi:MULTISPECIES: YrhK family protein [unclassified Vibrio]|uniref:YrhK family protein n=1 Tax=Vibrio sp. HB236076 TaxID=3232307 RepID=A0AB39HBR8_9VIBR|nr:YrhK family protein [Vibrio sp. HB161653]MDP5253440.1 YrhK family protein [Vibrio sp. HB161653]
MKSSTRLEFDLGHEHFIIQQRYSFFSSVNDLLIAIWFLIGSFFFLSDQLVTSGTWLFIVGSAQLLIKPMINLAGLVHVRRIRERQINATS